MNTTEHNDTNGIRYIEAKDAAGLKSMVTKAVNSYGKARIAVQVAIIAILCHAAKHHDYSQASALVNGLGNTQAARSVARFFQDFGGLGTKQVKDEATGEMVDPSEFNTWQGPDYITGLMDDGTTRRLDAAKATMYWEYRQPRTNAFKQYTTEDLAREFINRVNRVRKQAKAGKAELVDNLSDITMQEVLNLVKFERIAAETGESEAVKAGRKVANG